MDTMRARHALRCLLAGLSVLLGACTGAGPREPLEFGREHASVDVLYGTDRDVTGAHGAARYGSGRGNVSYGSVRVSIPYRRERGELPRPAWWRLELSEDPRNHVTLLGVEPLGHEAFRARLAAHLAAREKRLLVFIHGYNVSFEQAATRTAQLFYDLHFPGVGLFWSWPSQAREAAYTVDEQTIAWSAAHMHDFLVDVASRDTRVRVTVIAHSMGNRGLLAALERIARERPDVAARLEDVVLAAPDVDAEIFARDTVGALGTLAPRTTLYVSGNDAAMAFSRDLHGAPRLGDTRHVVVAPPLETVDVTRVDTSLVGHSYYGDNASVIADLFHLVYGRARAAARPNLARVPDAGYWVLEP